MIFSAATRVSRAQHQHLLAAVTLHLPRPRNNLEQ
jgi:hypothetical protein